MNEKECLEVIHEGQLDAYGLLCSEDPNFVTRFNRSCRTLVKLLKDVRKHFPDAQYYTASGGFNLMLGKPHSEGVLGKAQSELIAVGESHGLVIGDGDF